MSDGTIGFDEDTAHDYELDVDFRTVAGKTVAVTKLILVDGLTNNKAEVDADRNLIVKVRGVTDVSSRGASGSAPTSQPVGVASTTLLGAGTNRRCVWFTNTGTTTVWVTPGGAAAATARGIPLYAGMTIGLDASPNAAFTAISESGSNTVAIGIEAD